MEKMPRQLPLNPTFIPPPYGVLRSLLENPLKLPLHEDGERCPSWLNTGGPGRDEGLGGPQLRGDKTSPRSAPSSPSSSRVGCELAGGLGQVGGQRAG